MKWILQLKSRRWWLGFLIILPTVEVIGYVTISNTVARKFLDDLLVQVGSGTAAGLMTWAACSLRRERNLAANSWMTIAVGLCVYSVGQLCFLFVEEVLKVPPYPGPADFLYGVSYLLLFLGFWRMPEERITPLEMWHNALDVAAMSVVGALAIWQFNLRLLVQSLAVSPNAGTWVSLGYTLADTLLLLLIFSKLVRNLGQGRQFVPLLLLVLSFFCMITADMLQGYVTTWSNFTSGSPIDWGYLMFSVLSGLAALKLLSQGQGAANQASPQPEQFRSLWTLSITYLWITLVVAVLLWSAFHRNEIPAGFLVAGVLAAMVLAATRQLRTLVENQRLYQKLQVAAAELDSKVAERTAELERQSEQLRESEAFRKRIFESSHVPIVVMDAATQQFIDCNPAATEIYRYRAREETLGKRPLDVSAPEQYDGTQSAQLADLHIEQAAAQGAIVFEWRHQRPNGEIWDAEVHLMSFQSGERQLLQFTLQDITERKRAEERIRQQAALLAASHDATLVWHTQNGVQFMNPAAETLTGTRLVEAQAKTLAAVLRPRAEVELRGAINETLNCGGWTGELALLASDGSVRTIASRWAALTDAQGKALSVLITCNDITDQKQLQAQYLRAQRLESVGTLASGVAHDLNNILSPILLGLDVLETTVADAESRDTVVMMKDSARRGSDTVKQLLTFARGADSQKGLVQPRHLVKEITRLMTQTFPKNIQIYSDFTGQPATVLADASQLHQVLMNLCVNARDAMPEGGVLFLNLKNLTLDTGTAKLHPKARPITYVVFEISDSGTGIPPEVMERIFDPFFTTKPQGKGTGLGLSTVLGIVENHDGFLQVESSVSQGTKFQVFIPADASAAEPAVAASEVSTIPQGHGECLLVVDDEPAIVRTAESVLRKGGYETMSAGNASEAVHLFERHHDRIKAVLTDVMMPFGDGRSLIVMIFEQAPKLPIIAMSGLSSKELQADLKTRGARLFLSKPFTAEQLLTCVAQVLHGAP